MKIKISHVSVGGKNINHLLLLSVTSVVFLSPIMMSNIAQADSGNTLSIFAGNGNPAPPTPGPATSSSLDIPADVAVDKNGNVFIADVYSNVIEKVTPSGNLSIFAGNGTQSTPTPGPATSSSLNNPASVAVDNSGNVYIADTGNNVIEKVTPSGTLSIFAGNGNYGAPTPGTATNSDLAFPTGVEVDNSGNVYIADTSNNVIEKVTQEGTLSIIAGNGTQAGPTPGPATSSSLSYPRSVAIDNNGNIYIADEENQVIEKINPEGTLSIFAGNVNGNSNSPTPGPATSSDLNFPTGLAVDNSGNVYIADNDNNVVEKVTPDGTLSIFAGNGNPAPPTPGPATSSSISYPNGVAVDSNGNVYIADEGNNVIEKVTVPETTTVNISNATNNGSVGITTSSGTNITCSSSVSESSLTKQDPGYNYPLGLINLCFNTSNNNNQVSLTFVTNLTPSQVIARDYNTTTDSYMNVPGAVITETTYNSSPALNLTYTITDNGPLDSNDITGTINDPVGLAVSNATITNAPNTGYGVPRNNNYKLFIITSFITIVIGLGLRIYNRKLIS